MRALFVENAEGGVRWVSLRLLECAPQAMLNLISFMLELRGAVLSLCIFRSVADSGEFHRSYWSRRGTEPRLRTRILEI